MCYYPVSTLSASQIILFFAPPCYGAKWGHDHNNIKGKGGSVWGGGGYRRGGKLNQCANLI